MRFLSVQYFLLDLCLLSVSLNWNMGTEKNISGYSDRFDVCRIIRTNLSIILNAMPYAEYRFTQTAH